MARVCRDTIAGQFHVYTHCVWGVPAYFRDDIDRLNFLRGLARVTRRSAWRCIAYCLMTSHYHLIVDVADGVLPTAMHSLNLGYSLTFNRRHGLKGHAQHAQYGAGRIGGAGDLLDRFAYVVNNPVTAGLCGSPEEWSWSSYAGTIDLRELDTFVDPAPLLACFDWRKGEPKASLRRHVNEWRLARDGT